MQGQFNFMYFPSFRATRVMNIRIDGKQNERVTHEKDCEREIVATEINTPWKQDYLELH